MVKKGLPQIKSFSSVFFAAVGLVMCAIAALHNCMHMCICVLCAVNRNRYELVCKV